jgi:hypothetical protein
MDLSKLTKADKILFGAGLVFLISTFMPWFTLGPYSANGWDVNFLTGGLPFFIVAGVLVWVGMRLFSTAKLPPDIPALYLAAGALTALLVVLRLIIGYHSVDRGWGLYLATIAALGFGFGGFLKFQEGGGDLDTLRAQMKAKASELGDKK